MILELKKRVDFAGQAARVRCFLHVGNLVGKTMVRAFDVPKDTIERDNDLQNLGAEGLDIEDWQTMAENGDDPIDSDVDSWVDEIPLLTPAERRDLENQVRPVWIALTKVRLLDRLTFGHVLRAITPNSIRFESWHSRLFIPQPSSCLHGMLLALNRVSN